MSLTINRPFNFWLKISYTLIPILMLICDIFVHHIFHENMDF